MPGTLPVIDIALLRQNQLLPDVGRSAAYVVAAPSTRLTLLRRSAPMRICDMLTSASKAS